MKFDSRNNTFTIKEAITSIVYQLRICKQKRTYVPPFQAHFGRKPIIPLINISTIPKPSNLSYENILLHYLDADTVPVEDYLDENGWVTGDRSDTLLEEVMQKAQVDAGRNYNGDTNTSYPGSSCIQNSITRLRGRRSRWKSYWHARCPRGPREIFVAYGKHWPGAVRLSELLTRQQSLRNPEYLRYV